MTLILEKLKAGFAGVTPALGSVHFEACLVCLNSQGHQSEVELIVQQSDKPDRIETVAWSTPVTDQMIRAYADNEVTTEYGAYGLAFLLIEGLTGYTIIQKSSKGKGFDYWLGKPDKLPFQAVALLEVSGIRKAANESIIRMRLREKIAQVGTGNGLPAYICVIEFG